MSDSARQSGSSRWSEGWSDRCKLGGGRSPRKSGCGGPGRCMRGRRGESRSVNGRGRRRWKVEQSPHVNGVARQTVGTPDVLHAYTETPRERKDSITWLDSVPRNPAERRTTGKGPWSRTGVQGRRQINLLAGIDRRCTQTVGLHQCERSNTSSPAQAVECFPLLYGVGNPARGW